MLSCGSSAPRRTLAMQDMNPMASDSPNDAGTTQPSFDTESAASPALTDWTCSTGSDASASTDLGLTEAESKQAEEVSTLFEAKSLTASFQELVRVVETTEQDIERSFVEGAWPW